MFTYILSRTRRCRVTPASTSHWAIWSTWKLQEKSLSRQNCIVWTMNECVLLKLIVLELHPIPVSRATFKFVPVLPTNTSVLQTVWKFASLMYLQAGYLLEAPPLPSQLSWILMCYKKPGFLIIPMTSSLDVFSTKITLPFLSLAISEKDACAVIAERLAAGWEPLCSSQIFDGTALHGHFGNFGSIPLTSNFVFLSPSEFLLCLTRATSLRQSKIVLTALVASGAVTAPVQWCKWEWLSVQIPMLAEPIAAALYFLDRSWMQSSRLSIVV